MESVREELHQEALAEHPVYCVGCGGSYPRRAELGPTLDDHECSGLCADCGATATTWVGNRPLCTGCASHNDGDGDSDDTAGAQCVCCGAYNGDGRCLCTLRACSRCSPSVGYP